MDEKILGVFDASLSRCNIAPQFLDRFYERFLASSPKVREKFANTNFVRQKRALRASLQILSLVADDDRGPGRYLGELAVQHGQKHLDIGAELYDLWLDSLIATVREIDPQFDAEIEGAWEQVAMVGIHYMISKRDSAPRIVIVE